MFKVRTLNKISTTGLDLLPRDDYEIASEIMNPDAIILRSFNMLDMELASNLKAVARAGAGYNNVPVDNCSEKGIVVFNTPGANANGVKELVLTSLFMSSRRINEGINWAKTLIGKGDEVPKLVEKGKSQFAGSEIKGKKLGVIGLGAIGVMVANDAEALGMQVTGFDPFISVEHAWGLSRTVKKGAGLESIFKNSDYISIHVPLTDETRGMINSEKFALMKKGVCLLNFARGGLVNNKDLKKAIDDGIVGCYVTDFPDEEVLKMDKVIGVPHLGASTKESEENCAMMAANQVRDFLENGNIVNSVNLPSCEMPFVDKSRLIIINQNIPKMVVQITGILAEEHINIAHMLNRNKGGISYNIIDSDNDIPEATLKKIQDIDGVIMARVIIK